MSICLITIYFNIIYIIYIYSFIIIYFSIRIKTFIYYCI